MFIEDAVLPQGPIAGASKPFPADVAVKQSGDVAGKYCSRHSVAFPESRDALTDGLDNPSPIRRRYQVRLRSDWVLTFGQHKVTIIERCRKDCDIVRLGIRALEIVGRMYF